MNIPTKPQASAPASQRKSTKRRVPSFYRQILFLQFAASVICVFLASNYLPSLWRYGLVILLAAALTLSYLLIFAKRSRLISYFGKFLSIAMSAVLLTTGLYTNKGTTTINGITDGGDVETVEFSVIALKDSGYSSVKDIEGIVAYNRSYDEDYAPQVIARLTKDMGRAPETDSYSQFDYLKAALYNKKVDAIFFNGTYRDFLYTHEEDSSDTFHTDTVLLATYVFETGNSLASTAVADITKDCFIAYISGIDTRSDELTSSSRSDSNHIVVVNPQTKQILFIGIPRDYYIYIPAEQKEDKLTHSGNYGVNASIDALELLFDNMEINYYVRVNFAAAISVVDALDGVDVNSPVAFTTLDGKYEIKEGMNHLNGDMALYFMRTRYGLAGGDNARVTNQARVLKAVLKKVMSFSAVSNFNDILNAASKSSKTNMSSKEIKQLIKLQLDEMPDWDIQNYQLKGDGTKFNSKGQSIMVPEMETVEKAIDLIHHMQNNDLIHLEELK